MKRNKKSPLLRGILLLSLFGVWTVLVQTVDAGLAGEASTEVGFVTWNRWFHRITGVSDINKIDSLDHTAVPDVQAGNDAFGQHSVHTFLRQGLPCRF